MNRVAIAAILGSLVLATSCEKNAKRPVVEKVDGVEIVHNPAIPIHPNKTVVFTEELAIDGTDENGELRLYRPGRFAVNEDGWFYIADVSDETIKIFDAEGKFIKSVGAKGSGPGEFQTIIDLKFLPDGRLFVLDYMNRRASIFDKGGAFLVSIPLEAAIFNIFLTTDSTVTTEFNVYEKGRQLFVKTFDLSGKELVSFGEFRPFYPEIVKTEKATFAMNIPYSPHSIFAGDQKRQRLYHCLNNRYLIEVYDHRGKLFRKIERPYEPLPFTEDEKSEYLAEMKKNRNEVFYEMAKKMDLPDVKTVTEYMLVDDQGNLWVETHEEKEENGAEITAWDVFDPNGDYDARVWLEFRPVVIRGGKVYTRVMVEESGAVVIKRYGMKWVNR